MGQLAVNQNTSPVGSLPSDTEKNPQISAITLRTGRELEEVPKKKKDKPIPEGELIPRATQEAKKDDTVSAPIQLNIPLVDAICDIPKYAKYIKDIVANRRRLTKFETVALTEECTSRVQNKLPQKLKDPGSFTIPVRIGDAIIKVREGKIIMRVDNEEAVFNVYKAIQLPRHYEELSMISVMDMDEQLIFPSVYLKDSLEKAIVLFESLEIKDEVEEMKHILNASCEYMKGLNPFEPLNRPNGPPPKPSIEEAPKLELKPLPSHLHYAYLGSSDTLHVIISSNLSELQEEKLLRVLREHKRAIGWTMSDIRGISPAFCMHKILMEEGHKPSIKQQCHLNPNMKRVVRKEEIKWLDAGIVFPISDSIWASPVHVFQRKEE
ncbi:uncharacterized protein [Nicotiana sylvestris]|uniref:uncharacterized protein n=1 Tax=Nicotiana sylvestris TaxID=4096 RepID=UPI00388CD234